MLINPIIKAKNISEELVFRTAGKEIAFVQEKIDSLFKDIITFITTENQTSQTLGNVFASYLHGEHTLVSAFNWETKQNYYDRFIISGSEKHHITLMALIWPENTFSSVHYHQSWCLFGVYNGSLTETIYSLDSTLSPKATRHYPKGAWAYDSANGTKKKYYHRLGNVGITPVISFHLYGVAPSKLHKINCVVSQ